MSARPKRVAKKMAARAVCAALSIPYVLAHARPSFWALRDIGLQRACIREQLKKLRTNSRGTRRWVSRRWVPQPELANTYRAMWR